MRVPQGAPQTAHVRCQRPLTPAKAGVQGNGIRVCGPGFPHRRAEARRPSANLLFALCGRFPPAKMVRGNQGKGRAMTPLRVVAVLCATIAGAGSSYADCSSLHRLAQQHANDMARRNSLDHSGFMRHRGPAGAVAENVAVGCDTEACARRMWMQSPAHRRNMTLGGCQAVASAVSATGRRYWAMLVGGDSRAVDSRAVAGRAGGKLARVPRRAGAHDGLVGRDFSIDGSNAP